MGQKVYSFFFVVEISLSKIMFNLHQTLLWYPFNINRFPPEVTPGWPQSQLLAWPCGIWSWNDLPSLNLWSWIDLLSPDLWSWNGLLSPDLWSWNYLLNPDLWSWNDLLIYILSIRIEEGTSWFKWCTVSTNSSALLDSEQVDMWMLQELISELLFCWLFQLISVFTQIKWRQ